MLTPLFDFRSGNKIELIIPTFNEQANIKRIIKAYHEIADIVLIDDNSTDDTIDIAKSNFCSVFIRNREIEPKSFAPTEVPITYYVNELSLSKKCIKLDADEMIKYNDFKKIVNLLDYYKIVLCKRIDVISGKTLNYTSAIFPLGFTPGSIKCLNRLHSAIQPIDNITFAPEIFQNFHIDLVVEYERYGKYGKYTLWEIDRTCNGIKFSTKFYRRFLVPIFTFSFRNFHKHSIKLFIHYITKYILDFFLAVIIIQNNNLFGDKEKQIHAGNLFFWKNINK